MSTKPIDYMVVYYGDVAWRDLVVRWNGTGTSWRLFEEGVSEPLYEGADQQYIFTGHPSTRYQFRVETTVDGEDYSSTVLTYTTTLPAPINLGTSDVTDATATLTWNAGDGVESYEIGDVSQSYAVVGASFDPTFTVTRLSPSSRCSYAVRNVYKGERSRWSRPITFFTHASSVVSAGVYDFAPSSTYVWRAGRVGSTNPSWAPTNSNWFHGDGFVWGDNHGVQSTYFFFGSPNPFNVLYGATVTKCEVFLSRYTTGGDPGPVLSRVGLHENTEKPDGEPTPTDASVDVGELNRGQSGWFEVPTEWAEQLIIGAFADGWYWGGCHERFEMAKNVNASVTPRLGMIRITVG